jgi:hypothetical protein
MKLNRFVRIIILVILPLLARFDHASAQGTAFTYQGRLNDNGGPASGLYDLEFTLYGGPAGGNVLAGPLTNAPTSVSNGAFVVTLDFGPGSFPGADRWLEIGARTNGANTFAVLSPRQQFTPTPYAITAANVSSGGLPGGTYSSAFSFSNSSNTFNGTYVGDGAGLSNVSAQTVGGLVSSSFWQLGGNVVAPGQFLGSSNNQPLEFKVNNRRAFRLEPLPNVTNQIDLVNVVGGSLANFVGGGVVGGTIAGGGASYWNFSAQNTNVITGNFGTVGGGSGNKAGGGSWGTVAGGLLGTASGTVSSMGGGYGNTASGYAATVPGGAFNAANGDYSFACGEFAKAVHSGSFVWADAAGVNFSSTAINQFSVRASGGVLLAADVQIGTGSSDYHRMAIGGGNSTGFLYGSYPHWGDGVHLGYNYYADASGLNHVIASDGATSRISVGYGSIVLATGGIGAQPSFQNMVVSTTSVTVNGTFNNNSDRNAKQDFEFVSSSQILDRLSRLPVSEWSYKSDSETRHIGPMAQDFYAAFKIGTDDKHIAPIDEGGVALAAIQGLNRKLEQQLQQKETEIAELKQRMDKLERLLSEKTGDPK